MGLGKVCFELDCKAAMAMINSPGKNMSNHGSIIEQIKRLLGSFEDAKVCWAPREANRAAHLLARHAICLSYPSFWPISPPDFILEVVSDEVVTIYT